MLSWIGGKLWGVLAAAGAFAVLILNTLRLSRKAEREEKRANRAEAGIERKARAEAREAEIDSEWSDKERVAREDIDEVPDWLRNRRKR